MNTELETIYARFRAEADPLAELYERLTVKSAGTSEGAKKGWDNRHVMTTRFNSGTSSVHFKEYKEGTHLESREEHKGVEGMYMGTMKTAYKDLPSGTHFKQLPGGLMAEHPSVGKFMVRQYPHILENIAKNSILHK